MFVKIFCITLTSLQVLYYLIKFIIYIIDLFKKPTNNEDDKEFDVVEIEIEGEEHTDHVRLSREEKKGEKDV